MTKVFQSFGNLQGFTKFAAHWIELAPGTSVLMVHQKGENE
jgi:uncharacterized cupin superfamily protein